MKLRRKLLAAGFAFGATALTLTTSTFAWYTSNTEVNAGSVSGMTSSSTDSGSLYISNAKTYAGNTIGASATAFATYGTTATPVLVNSSAASSDVYLVPLAYDKVNTDASALTYNTMAAAGENHTYTAATNANNVYEYVLRFQVPNIAADTKVYVSGFTLTNSAAASNSQQLALNNNTDMGVSASAANAVGVEESGYYNVDMLHALKLTVTATPVQYNSTAEGDKFTVVSASAATKVYDLDSFAQTSKDVNVDASYPNAVGYYNAALGTSISKPSGYLSGATAIKVAASAAAANSSTSNLFTVSKDYGYVEVRFTFWLDGWDEYCYDVCRKQNFTASMQFSVSDSKSILTTA